MGSNIPKIGADDIVGCYLGSDEIEKIYLGTNTIYEKSSGEPSYVWDLQSYGDVSFVDGVGSNFSSSSYLETKNYYNDPNSFEMLLDFTLGSQTGSHYVVGNMSNSYAGVRMYYGNSRSIGVQIGCGGSNTKSHTLSWYWDVGGGNYQLYINYDKANTTLHWKFINVSTGVETNLTTYTDMTMMRWDKPLSFGYAKSASYPDTGVINFN